MKINSTNAQGKKDSTDRQRNSTDMLYKETKNIISKKDFYRHEKGLTYN